MENKLACLVVNPDGICYYLNMELVTGLTQAFIIFWGLCFMFKIILGLLR